MAKTTTNRKPRQPKVYADEEAIKAKIDALTEKENLTDKQKEEVKTHRRELGALKFKRLAKQRGAKAVIAIRNLGKLGGAGYTRTEEQVNTLKKLLTDETNSAIAALGSVKKGEKPTIQIDI
jgi:adenosylmethionine-8-amino-7-oxononanoate aminotransferase